MTPEQYILLSVFGISLLSFIGVFTLSIKKVTLDKMLLYLVAFSAGALIGDSFLHLLPEIIAEIGFETITALYVILGLLSMFIVEKLIRWRHCHHSPHRHTHAKIEPFAMTSLIGDGIHNFIDGLLIGASYILSIPVGIATTIAVALHEIPQEIGDFAVLTHGGLSRKRALLLNFATALMAVIGALLAIYLTGQIEGITNFLIPFAAGHFIYIATADLIPELHKEENLEKSTIQVLWFLIGIGIMYALL
jgi:zinc and cadmium transporter|tara:strand:+ start:5078 stop:5824 length:747 start_codon:yes stop_codon:yes gene_type:complete